MAVSMRERAASGVMCLSCAAAMVWWPPPPSASMITCTFTAPRLRAEMFTPVPTCTATKLASTPWMRSRSLAACAMATRASGAISTPTEMAQFLYIRARSTSSALAAYSTMVTSNS